tara:strand:- start:1371 stop:2000 length:630 start_codon:yes stop_codon:yes gene_type:complete
MSYIPKENVTQSFKNNKGIFTPNQIIKLDHENKYTKYGQLELITTSENISDVNFVDFTNIKEDEYDVHFITVSNFQAVSSSISGGVRLFEQGVIESGAVYDHAALKMDNSTGSTTNLKSTASSGLGISFDFDPQTSRNVYFYLYSAGDPTKYTVMTHHHTGINNSAIVYKFGGGGLPQQSIVDGFRIYSASSDNMNIDSVSVYGIRTYK